MWCLHCMFCMLVLWKENIWSRKFLEVDVLEDQCNHRRLHTRAVRKVSIHFEYLENRLRGLDVTCKPVRGNLTAHP
jgi:hypothetical protein